MGTSLNPYTAELNNLFTGVGPLVDTTAFGEQTVAELSPQTLIHFPYNLNTDIVNTTVAGSGAVTHSGQFAVMASGAASSSSGMLRSNRFLEYHPGHGGLIRFTTIWGTGTTGNTQIAGCGNNTDGYFFGYNGNEFGVLRREGSVDTWVAQTAWNIDKMDGTGPSGMTLDTTKGNVFQIRYQWLGFGAIKFYIENVNTGTLQLVHRLDYTNQNTTTSVENPSFPFCAESANTTNTTDIQMKVPSIAMFIEGKESSISHTRNAQENQKSLLAATETNVLTIRNKTTHQGIANQIQIQPDLWTIASDGSKNFNYRVYINATLGGTPSYTDVSTNTSVVDYDTAGTTVSGGTLIASIASSKTGDKIVSAKDYQIIMAPGDTMTVSAESAGTGDALVGISWQERFS